MKANLKVFGPYGVKPRVREEMEKDFQEWIKDKSIALKDILPATASLPDRTTLLLIFYNEEGDERGTAET